MSVIQIKEAQRSGARLVIGLQGISGSGKTRTAIEIAFGLANYDAKKIGFLDTENRRGSLYANVLDDEKKGVKNRFLIGDLTPPFTPSRYVEAIKQFEAAGVEVLVIDSVSHEWAGQGGCYDIAKNTSKRIDDWLTAKSEHKKFISALLQSPMHIIACVREAPKTDFKDPKNPRSLGLMPIQESQFVFELTASLQMWNSGKSQHVLKCPEELLHILGRQEGYITPADGRALRAWVDGAEDNIDPQVLRWKDRLIAITEMGAKSVRDAWSQLPVNISEALGADFQNTLIQSAEEFDRQRAAKNGDDKELSDLGDRLAGGDRETEKQGTGD